MGKLFKNQNCRRQFPPTDVCFWLLRALFLMLLIVVTGLVSIRSLRAQGCSAAQDGPRTVAPGEVVKCNLKAKEKHLFQVMLSPEQYVRVVVEQKGIDVVVKLFDPNHGLLIERDSPNGRFSAERVSAVAQSRGTYYVEVLGADNEPAGAYELRLEGPQQKTAADDRRVLAEQVSYEAAKVLEQRTVAANEAALEYYRESAKIWRELVDSVEEGYALCNIGEVYRTLRKFPDSEDSLTAAVARLRDANDISGHAYALNALGATYRDLGPEPRKAFEKYQESIVLRRTIGDRWGEAQMRNNIAFLHARLGQNQEAIEGYTLAHALWRDLGVPDQAMNTLNNIAAANLEMGNMTEAVQQLEEVLTFCAQSGGPCRLEPFVRNSLGVIYDTWAQPNDALVQYNLALTLYRQAKTDTKSSQATTLDNLGLLFASLEDPRTALANFEEALKLRIELKNPGLEAMTRSNIGYAQILLGKNTDALDQLEQALLLSQGTNERYEAYTLMRLGMAHFKLNNAAKALERYGQALEIQTRLGDIRGQAMTLDQMADLYSSIEQAANARRDYRKAQERWKSLGDSQGEAISLYGLAKLERQQKKLPEARQAIVEAIEKVESIRTRTSNYRLRKTYFEKRHDYYELETDIRMQLYYSLQAKKSSAAARAELELALFASERARSRNLLDLLSESQADIRVGVDPVLLEKERNQRRQIEGKLERLQLLAIQKEKEAQRTEVQRQLEELNRSLEHTQAEIRDRSPRYAALTQPQPLQPAKIQELLDDETCLLQYALGEERSYLWLVTRNGIRPYTLPAEAEIKKAVVELLDGTRKFEGRKPSEDPVEYIKKLNQARANYPKQVLNLSNLVLKPVASRIGYKRIIIVPDGVLHYFPLGALPVPNEANPKAPGQGPPPLLANHDVIYEPSASVLALIRSDRRRTAARTVAVIADPVFSKRDERVQAAPKDSSPADVIAVADKQFLTVLRDVGDIGSVNGSLRLLRLSHSRKEAEAIAAVAAPESSMVALDFDANRARVLSDELKDFKIIHLATHGIMDSANPELSGLVFSLVDKQGRDTQGFLRLSDIYNLNLPADLVVLSACQTAVGQQFESEGLTGLTRGFMYAGAGRVVASLWKVDDSATAELMKRFYSYMLDKKLPPSVALRQAQLDVSSLREDWRPAFFWAGFVLQGEWK